MRWHGYRLWLAALLLTLGGAFVSLAGGAGARQAAEPIEGTWNYGSGQVVITPTGAGAFQGVVTKQATISTGCPHPVGEVMWRLRGSGTHYKGTHLGVGSGGCSDRVSFPATFDVSERGGKFILHLCVTITMANNTVGCYDSNRAKPPATTPTTTPATTPVTTPATTPVVPKPKPAAGTKIYRWFAHAFYSNAKTATVTSYAEGPRGGERGLLTVVSGRASGGKSARFRITDTLKSGKKRMISMLTDGVARLSLGAGGTTVVLRAHVTGSTHPDCKEARRVVLTLVDGTGATPDSVEVKGCGPVRRYIERQAHMKVHVVIGE